MAIHTGNPSPICPPPGSFASRNGSRQHSYGTTFNRRQLKKVSDICPTRDLRRVGRGRTTPAANHLRLLPARDGLRNALFVYFFEHGNVRPATRFTTLFATPTEAYCSRCVFDVLISVYLPGVTSLSSTSISFCTR